MGVPERWERVEIERTILPEPVTSAVGGSKLDSGADGRPAELSALLGASDPSARQAAWDRFVRKYNRILLHTAHRRCPGYDDAMNRYAHVLEKLREDDFRRLRAYQGEGRARFTTWLVVVSRRLCIDYLRSRYGRERETEESDRATSPGHRLRRQLADLVGEDLDLERIPDPAARSPDAGLRERELAEALLEAVQALPARDRLLLKLRFDHELAGREIAELMEFPTMFHVYRRLRKVLAGLRERLEANGIADPAP